MRQLFHVLELKNMEELEQRIHQIIDDWGYEIFFNPKNAII
jgi:hypothetical protein